jgi:hypothetical protein
VFADEKECEAENCLAFWFPARNSYLECGSILQAALSVLGSLPLEPLSASPIHSTLMKVAAKQSVTFLLNAWAIR